MTGGMKSGTGLFMSAQDPYRKFTPEEETKFKNKLIMDPAAVATAKKKKKPTDTIAASTKLTG